MESKKLIIMVVCIVLIIFCSVMIVLFRDVLFTQKIDIKYADGCVEHYNNGILNSSICEYGRELDKQKQYTGNQWQNKLITNLTV